ncbi:MAG: DUF547 domain-containing protein [Bacteroidota bacterium]
MIRNILLFILLCICIQGFTQNPNSAEDFFQQADEFFAKYVSGDAVDYPLLRENMKDVYTLVRKVMEYDLEGKDAATQKAFLINAYNLQVIKSVIDAWPINSPQSVEGFFDGKRHVFAGQSYTLNDFEKKEVFGRFPDPRLHFVLVCAAKGCPPITNFAYTPNSLEEQLDRQTRLALSDPNFVQVDPERQRVGLSQIFEWYGQDFKTNGRRLLEYVNVYRESPIPDNYQVRFYPYDWTINAESQLIEDPSNPTSNIQQFTPSVLLKKGQVEIKWFNNLYTQTAFRDNERERVELGQRETFFTGIFQFNYGVSQNRRWNVGFEVDYSAVRLDANESNSALKVLGSDETDLIFRKSAISYIGPRIRFSPFPKVPKFSLTSTLQIPVSNDLELFADGQRRFLAHNRVNWWTQFFYDKTFGKWQLFTEVDFLFRFPTDQVSFNQDAFFLTPVIAFLSYFPNPKVTLNVNAQYWPTFQGLPGNSAGEGFSLSGDFVQLGVGGKYQLTPEINLEVIYTNFATSRNNGAGQTFNFGVVFIK